jgi:hypothetical protein
LKNLFHSANTTLASPMRAHFRSNFFIFPFATTTVKGPAFSKSGNKKAVNLFQDLLLSLAASVAAGIQFL